MDEHTLRLSGASYAEIAAAGGGILTTVEAVRNADEAELVRESRPRIEALASEGVTCIEVKSGYGLTLDDELKMLRAIRTLGVELGVELVPSFLGAHAVPPERERTEYLEEVIEQMLPAVAAEQLAVNVDIFIEGIGFDCADARRLFERARALGLNVRAHTDQLSRVGGTALAAEAGALSCDHLEYAQETDVAAMAAHGTTAVLLPGAFYFLRETRKPPIELLRKHKVKMALASDLNPGSSPVASLLTAAHMGTILFGLTPMEAIEGITCHAASALGRRDIGRLAPGARANFALWDLPAPEFLVYQLGGLKPADIFIDGERVV